MPFVVGPQRIIRGFGRGMGKFGEIGGDAVLGRAAPALGPGLEDLHWQRRHGRGDFGMALESAPLFLRISSIKLARSLASTSRHRTLRPASTSAWISFVRRAWIFSVFMSTS